MAVQYLFTWSPNCTYQANEILRIPVYGELTDTTWCPNVDKLVVEVVKW